MENSQWCFSATTAMLYHTLITNPLGLHMNGNFDFLLTTPPPPPFAAALIRGTDQRLQGAQDHAAGSLLHHSTQEHPSSPVPAPQQEEESLLQHLLTSSSPRQPHLTAHSLITLADLFRRLHRCYSSFKCFVVIYIYIYIYMCEMRS